MDPHETGIAAPKHAGNKPAGRKRQKQKKKKKTDFMWSETQWLFIFTWTWPILCLDGQIQKYVVFGLSGGDYKAFCQILCRMTKPEAVRAIDQSTRNTHGCVFDQRLILERCLGRLEVHWVADSPPKVQTELDEQASLWSVRTSYCTCVLLELQKISPFPSYTDINLLCLITLSQVSEFT